MNYRTEKDSLGEVLVDADKLWGAQTQRSLENFKIGWEKMPVDLIKAFILIKKAAAGANQELDLLTEQKANQIISACDEILNGEFYGQFPLSVWQTGSGTQTNMNVNEVLAHMTGLHPNDDVNKGQSSNDTFPSAMHIAAVLATCETLFPALTALEGTFSDLSIKYDTVIKIGRTHLQDATPLTLGQEISAWAAMLTESKQMIEGSLKPVRQLALGGTAVGTGLNSHKDFGSLAAEKISRLTGQEFITAKNKFHALTSKDGLVFLHGALKALAADLLKIVNDIRLLSSGPRCGIGEFIIPENEPGSSIMPGKVNPTQCEALAMVCCQVMGNDVTIGIAASQGHLQLNTFMPVIIYNVLQSIRLLSDAMASFNKNCVVGIRPHEENIQKYLRDSLMLVTCLTPKIGYDHAAHIAKSAYEKGTTLREEAILLGVLSGEEFDRLVRPEAMV